MEMNLLDDGTGGVELINPFNLTMTLMNANGSFPSNVTNISSETGEDAESYQQTVPWWRQLLWSVLFGGMVIVATVGNLVVIWIVLAHKRMRTVTNYLLVNLSIADAMVSTLNVIPNYIYMMWGHWPFGALYCKIVQSVAVLSICGSVFSLMAIAFDRYMAIMNPLRPRMGRRITLGIAGGIWLCGCAFSIPMMIYFTTFQEDDMRIVCYSEWPDGPQTRSRLEYYYNVWFMLFAYFMPIGVMGFTYTRVGIELWSSKSIGECTQRQMENVKSKRRVVKMMIVVVSIFAFCWLPYHIYFIVGSEWPDINKLPYVKEIFLGCYWLAMSNSCYNPIIYCWMNARFRRGFQQVFSWCPFVHYNEEEGTTAHMMRDTRRDHTTRYSVTGSPEMHARIARNAGSAIVHIPLHVLTNKDSTGPAANKSGGSNTTTSLTVTNNRHHHHSYHQPHNSAPGHNRNKLT